MPIIQILKEFDWLGTAVVTALIAVLTYAAKQIEGAILRRRAERASRVAALQRLMVLLNATQGLYNIQARHRGRLYDLLERNHPSELPPRRGYEDRFARMYPLFTPKERELHGIIRTITIKAIAPVNDAMMQWLDDDRHFATGAVRLRCARDLAAQLQRLELHLRLWRAKFDY